MAVEVEITREKFRRVGANAEKREEISRPSLSFWQETWRRVRTNKVVFFSMLLIVLYIALAVFVPIFSPYSGTEQDVHRTFEGPTAQHWFGTDALGRDLFTRVWDGARISLFIGFAVSIINRIVGTILGGLAGYYGGKLDMIMMRIVDVLYGLPTMVITIMLMVVLKPGIHCLILAMVLFGWIGTCRFVRGEVLRLKNQEFVSASKILGVKDFTILMRHIVSNMMGLQITGLMMSIPGAIFTEAFLSYIGLGMAPPSPSWGVLAKEGAALLRTEPWMMFLPAFFISTTMLAMNLLGDGLRDAMDPKLRGSD